MTRKHLWILLALAALCLLLPSVSMAEQPLQAALTLSADTVAAGGSLTATMKASGGTEPYTYAFNWLVEENGQHQYVGSRDFASDSSHSLVIRFGQSGRVQGMVQDALGRLVHVDASFAVTESTPAPLSFKLTLSGDTFKPGDTVTAKTTVSGGVEPYSYQYMWFILENGERKGDVSNAPTTDSASTYLVGYGESGLVYSTVTDAVGRKWLEFASFTITGSTPGEPISFTAKLDKEETAAGTPLTVTVSDVKGGVPPYKYSYYWYKIGENGSHELFAQQKDSDALTCAQTIPAGTAGSGYVVVTDAQQRTQDAWLNFVILPSRTPGDADANGRVEIADLQQVVDHIVAKKPLGSAENANAHKDGKIDLQDALAIIHMIAP